MTRLRVQFFLDGPFDPIQALSVTFLDELHQPEQIVALGGEFTPAQMMEKLAEEASKHERYHGSQLSLHDV